VSKRKATKKQHDAIGEIVAVISLEKMQRARDAEVFDAMCKHRPLAPPPMPVQLKPRVSIGEVEARKINAVLVDIEFSLDTIEDYCPPAQGMSYDEP
jgi:hypothetical protein